MELLILLAITGAVVGLAGRLPERSRVKRELARARIKKIAGLVDGAKVAIRGEVAISQLADDLVAPLSGRRCVYWLVTFDELCLRGEPIELGRTEQGTSFLVTDERAKARVVIDQPRVALPGYEQKHPIAVLRVPAFDAMTRLAKAARMKPPTELSSWLRATEYIVTPGMPVTVIGWCTYEPDLDAKAGESDYRAEPPTRPVISGSRGTRLLIG